MFTGLWLPLITPFRNGQIDHAALQRLVEHYASTGLAGFVACGSTGEAAALDEAEQISALETILRACKGLPVVMGLSGYHLEQTRAWVRRLADFQIAGVLVPAPHYIRPPQTGLRAWFTNLADAAHVPLIIYDIPYRTGLAIETATLLQLAAHPNIKAIKDCGGDAVKTQALISDGRLQVLAGEDAQIFTTVCQGGSGAIAASAHLHTRDFVAVISLLQQGKLVEARQRWAALPTHIAAMFAQPNPICIKAALAQEGWINNELRAPMQSS
jgi:4-hydroxy-tetrahydrodipicolinate synthase